MKYKEPKTTCHCGAPRRKSGVYCRTHHAEKQREYRAAMKAAAGQSGSKYAEGVRAFKRKLLLHSVWKEDGNLCRAAIRLGIHRNTMNRVMREVGLTGAQVREYLAERKEASV